MSVPKQVWYWSVGLATIRLSMFYALQPTKIDALWQFAYLLLWIVDFPISVTYFAFNIPIPYGEAIIGPIWWFIIPILTWHFFQKHKNAQK